MFSPPSRQPKYATVAKAVFDLWVDNIFAVHRRAAEPIKSTDVNRLKSCVVTPIGTDCVSRDAGVDPP
jgi:hypothetical protein